MATKPSRKLPIPTPLVSEEKNPRTKKFKNKTMGYGIDQTFLKTIYNVFENDRCTHDDFFEKKPFPIKRENGRFVGERMNVNDEPLNNDYLAI